MRRSGNQATFTSGRDDEVVRDLAEDVPSGAPQEHARRRGTAQRSPKAIASLFRARRNAARVDAAAHEPSGHHGHGD